MYSDSNNKLIARGYEYRKIYIFYFVLYIFYNLLHFTFSFYILFNVSFRHFSYRSSLSSKCCEIVLRILNNGLFNKKNFFFFNYVAIMLVKFETNLSTCIKFRCTWNGRGMFATN